MAKSGYLVDSSLLVLLVAGRTDTLILRQHRRLREFSLRDFDLLERMIQDTGGTVFCTPNTLTEASNHLRQCREPWRLQLTAKLAELVDDSEEIIVISSEAVRHDAYRQLGLADAASLQVCGPDRPLLTVDFLLFNEALQKSEGSAVYFDAFREVSAT